MDCVERWRVVLRGGFLDPPAPPAAAKPAQPTSATSTLVINSPRKVGNDADKETRVESDERKQSEAVHVPIVAEPTPPVTVAVGAARHETTVNTQVLSAAQAHDHPPAGKRGATTSDSHGQGAENAKGNHAKGVIAHTKKSGHNSNNDHAAQQVTDKKKASKKKKKGEHTKDEKNSHYAVEAQASPRHHTEEAKEEAIVHDQDNNKKVAIIDTATHKATVEPILAIEAKEEDVTVLNPSPDSTALPAGSEATAPSSLAQEPPPPPAPPAPIASWQLPRWSLHLFVSSTFTDTNRERDLLMEQIRWRFAQLYQRNQEQNIAVNFVDMRWGVRDESSMDHKTWIECYRELQRCQRQSAGLFFLSLQSEKYGYISLPKYLRREVLEHRLLQYEGNAEIKRLAKQWYLLDTNHLPARYTLRSLARLDDDSYWNVALPQLRQALDGVPFDEDVCSHLVVGRSVTEWEAKAALSLDQTADPAVPHRAVWMHRQFQGGVTLEQDPRRFFSDAHHDDVKNKLAALKAWMTNHIPSTAIHSFANVTLTAYQEATAKKALHSYLQEWEQIVTRHLQRAIDHVKVQKAAWDASAMGLERLTGETAAEILQHYAWAVDKCSDYIGREELINSCLQALGLPIITKDTAVMAMEENEEEERRRGSQEDKAWPDRKAKATKNRHSKALGITLAVVGGSGCGKTALMAKLASLIYTAEQRRCQENPRLRMIPRPVLVRFCGLTAGSSSGLALIHSLCHQLHHLFPSVNAPSTLSEVYIEAVEYFHQLLASHPIILLIDSLDQLSDEELARSRVSFLRGSQPHQDSLIIVSCLPDDWDERSRIWKVYYGCDTSLKNDQVHRIVVPLLGTATEEAGAVGQKGKSTVLVAGIEDRLHEAKTILEALLQRQCRSLTSAQWRQVLQAVVEEPTALYLRLILRLISGWCSYDQTQAVLLRQPASQKPASIASDVLVITSTVQGIIMQLFSNLERQYGALLTRSILGMIAFAEQGVTDSEIEDLISLMDDVLDAVFQYHTPSIRRLPTHVWLRLKADLQGLIVERESGCLRFYHRQLQETAEVRYASDKTRLQRVMAVYYGNLADVQLCQHRQIARQPLVFLLQPSNGHAKPVGVSEPGADATEAENIVWFVTSSQVNRRHCREAGFHLLAMEMLAEAVEELCHFATVAAYVRVGIGFLLVKRLTSLFEKVSVMAQNGSSGNTAVWQSRLLRVHDYLHWLRGAMNELSNYRQQPLAILYNCTCTQPFSSLAYQDVLTYLQRSRVKPAAEMSAILSALITESPPTPVAPDKIHHTQESVDSSVACRMMSLVGLTSFDYLFSNLVVEAGDKQGLGLSFAPCKTTTSDGRADKPILAVATGKAVRLYDVLSGEVINEYSTENPIGDLAWHPTQNLLAIISDSTLYWDSTTGFVINEYHPRQPGHNFSWSRNTTSNDGHENVTSLEDTRVCYDGISTYHLDTCAIYTFDHKLLFKFPHKQIGKVGSAKDVCAFSRDMTRVAFEEGNGITIINILTNEQLKIKNAARLYKSAGGHDRVRLEHWSPNDQILVCCGHTLYNTQTGELICSFDGVKQFPGFRDCQWSSCSRYFASQSANGVQVWDASRGTVFYQRRITSNFPKDVMWCSDNVHIVVPLIPEAAFLIINIQTQVEKRVNTRLGIDGNAALHERSGQFYYVDPYFRYTITQDGRYIAVQYRQNIRVFRIDLNDDETSNSFLRKQQRNKLLASSTTAENAHANTSKVQKKKGTEAAPPSGNSSRMSMDEVKSMTFSPHGSYLLYASASAIWVKETKAGVEKNFFDVYPKHIIAYAFRNDEQRIAAVFSDQSLRCWNAGDGGELKISKLEDMATSLAYSSDGREIVLGCNDGLLHIVAADTLKISHSYVKWHDTAVTAVTWRGDGQMLLSADATQIVLWKSQDKKTCKRIPLQQHPKLLSLTVSACQNFVYGNGENEHVLIFAIQANVSLQFITEVAGYCVNQHISMPWLLIAQREQHCVHLVAIELSTGRQLGYLRHGAYVRLRANEDSAKQDQQQQTHSQDTEAVVVTAWHQQFAISHDWSICANYFSLVDLFPTPTASL